MAKWFEKRLDEIAEFNPRETLKKGSIAKKISMDKLQPFCRDVPGFELEPYSGGTKFRNGDTIMARITPCLENGKTAKVSVLENGEVGFGSTEYIVFRAKDGCDSDFLYYLVTSSIVRGPAIKSMVGSSGRQRVQTDVLQTLMVKVPDLETQQSISGILKSLDDKIAANRKINDNLADIIQSVYQNRFSSTRSDVTAGVLADICSYSKDKVPVLDLNNSNYYSTENMQSDKKGAVDAATLPTIAQTTKCRKGDVLISNIRPYFKKIVYCQFDCGCSTDVLCFCPKESALSAFLFSTLYADHFFDFMAAGAKGTKMPRGDKQQIMTYPIYLPSADELAEFNSIAIPALTQMECSRLENTRLTALRDALLPKLMSGELDVSAIEL